MTGNFEGWGLYADSSCGECSAPCPLYRCKDCFGGQLYCWECIVAMHHCVPFHITDLSSILALLRVEAVHILVLERQLLQAHNSQVSWPSDSAWPPPWGYLHQSEMIIKQWFCCHQLQWNTWSQPRLLRLRGCKICRGPTASIIPVPCHIHEPQVCCHLSRNEILPHPILWIEMFWIQVL